MNIKLVMILWFSVEHECVVLNLIGWKYTFSILWLNFEWKVEVGAAELVEKACKLQSNLRGVRPYEVRAKTICDRKRVEVGKKRCKLSPLTQKILKPQKLVKSRHSLINHTFNYNLDGSLDPFVHQFFCL